jgi:hypothetical protein
MIRCVAITQTRKFGGIVSLFVTTHFSSESHHTIPYQTKPKILNSQNSILRGMLCISLYYYVSVYLLYS